MQLHELKSKNKRIAKQTRIGRGGKRGTTSGRGQKGQRARSGHRIRPAVRDLLQRLPKLRGYSNNPKSASFQVLNVGDLNRLAGSEISLKTLAEASLIRGKKPVKILGSGVIDRKMTVTGIVVSKTAKEKIEAAGGTVSE